jgi:DNA-binding NarL/FixJ family response regulator
MAAPAVPAHQVGVTLVAAYPAVRAGLRALLGEDGRIEVIGEAASLGDLIAEASQPPDVVVLDLDLEGVWGSGEDFSTLPDGVGLVVLGPAAPDTRLLEPLGSRPWGYLLRDANAIELAGAIEAVAAGLIVLQPALADRLLSSEPPRTISDPGEEALTAREHEILQLIAEGLPNKTIALRLGISEHTVKFHITSILSKLDAGSRTEAVRIGARRGLVTL